MARLELLTGPLAQRCIEIHAGEKYLQARRSELERRGAVVRDPLQGLSLGERLAWYGPSNRPVEGDPEEDAWILDELLNETAAVSPDEFLSGAGAATNRPGLYSWWVDESGAATLCEGLGVSLSGPHLCGPRRCYPLAKWPTITKHSVASNHNDASGRKS